MIEIKNFTKKYGELTVYENFNLDIEEGKITCILGESGCGKTTLLNAIARNTKYRGNIPKIKCSYVFQTPRLVPNLNVLENLKLVCNDEEKIHEMLKKLDIAEKAECFPINLSGGQAQRVSVARAFIYDSELLLMDEPFSSLDLKVKSAIIELFFEIWKRFQRTVLFVTHDVDEAIALSQRILVLDKGNIKYDRTLSSSPPRALGAYEELRRELISVLV